MSPVTHLIGSWLVASVTADNQRDRKLVTLAGVLPDTDGLGLVVDIVGGPVSGKGITYEHYQQYHHVLLHGLPAAIAISGLLMLFARKRARVALMCLVVFHLHLLCDWLGSRGPSPADLWPICYGEPLFRQPVWFWKGQWRIDGWQNQSIAVLVFAASLFRAAKKGYSFIEVFSQRLDSVFVRVLQKWNAALISKAHFFV